MSICCSLRPEWAESKRDFSLAQNYLTFTLIKEPTPTVIGHSGTIHWASVFGGRSLLLLDFCSE